MAKIIYGIMGDARGHLSRSLAVAQSLPEHEFLFLGGGAVGDLRSLGYLVEDLPMASTYYVDNRVDLPSTVTNAARVLMGAGRTVARTAEIIREFDPDLILTDYELFTPLAARRLGRECISLDHQHVITKCRYDVPREQRLNRALTTLSIRALYSFATRYFIISFFEIPPADPTETEIFPPILRNDVADFRASEGEHVIVYLSNTTFFDLMPCLETLDRKVFIYGFGKKPPRKNLEFKEVSREGFLRDLASSAYIISSGGHALISEALYFGKPVLSLPIFFAYEQFLNGFFLSKQSLGQYWMGEVTADLFHLFEAKLETYKAAIAKKDFFGNHKIAARMKELIGK